MIWLIFNFLPLILLYDEFLFLYFYIVIYISLLQDPFDNSTHVLKGHPV